jgi:hypothetical protein
MAILGMCWLSLCGCQELDLGEPCSALPSKTACPRSRGGSCSDTTCSAIYNCLDGKWVFEESCPNFQANNGSDAGLDAGLDAQDGSSPEAGLCSPLVDLPPSDVGCSTLQEPECDQAVMQSCPENACSTGCEVFLRCVKGEWQDLLVGYCSEGELLLTNQP